MMKKIEINKENNQDNISQLIKNKTQEVIQKKINKSKSILSEANMHDNLEEKLLIQKPIKKSKNENKSFREIVISSEPLERRVALLIDGVLTKIETERANEERMIGAIFKGKIQNLEPGLKAAFVNIGQAKNAFLHYWDIIPNSTENQIEIVRENKSKIKKKEIALKDIPKLYPIGTNIIVQIIKTQIGTKGPRITTNISLPGRFIVLTPYSGQCGISKKIEDPKERDRLKKIIQNINLPEEMGLIIRTAGEHKKLRYFIRDLHLLLNQWKQINDKIELSEQPTLLDKEPSILERTVRYFLTEEIDRILVDSIEDQSKLLSIIQKISPRSKSKVFLFNDNIPIFERYNIERQIEQTFMRRVPLSSGGEIVIEETEALTAIDVNTGSHKESSKDSKNFIINVNLEAASESARQIKLRNIGGLIIIDFIDMKSKRDKSIVYEKMKHEMILDKSKSNILPISPLGIMQMTRQRHEESINSGVYKDCLYCYGRGIIKSDRTMSIEIQRKLLSIIRQSKRHNIKESLHYRVLLHPKVLERLRTEDEELLMKLEKEYNMHLSFLADPSYHIENYKIIDPKQGIEIH